MTAMDVRPGTADEFARTPPHDRGAEEIVLGSMMLSADAIADVGAVIKPGDHYLPAHQLIHEAILDLYGRSQATDVVTVADLMAKQGTLMRIGGGTVLTDCIAAVPTAAMGGHYARIVKEHAVKRGLIDVGTRVVQLAYAGEGEAAWLASQAQQMMEAVTTPAVSSDLSDIDELLVEVLTQLERQDERGLSTPWADLDKSIAGFAPEELVIIAARTGVGKSMSGLNIAAHVALRLGLPVAFFTMEMSRQEVMLRLISAEGRVPLTSLLRRELTEAHWDRVNDAREKIQGAPLAIDDSPYCTLPHIRGRLREMSRTAPPAIAIVDHMLLMSSTGKSENRQVEVAGFSRGLKLIAGEFGIPVVALSQLNRNPEHRTNKKPQLSDLRESGAQEQDASLVLLLHREDMGGAETDRVGEIDFIVAKNRNGPESVVTLAFQGEYARCVNMKRLHLVPGSHP